MPEVKQQGKTIKAGVLDNPALIAFNQSVEGTATTGNDSGPAG